MCHASMHLACSNCPHVRHRSRSSRSSIDSRQTQQSASLASCSWRGCSVDGLLRCPGCLAGGRSVSSDYVSGAIGRAYLVELDGRADAGATSVAAADGQAVDADAVPIVRLTGSGEGDVDEGLAQASHLLG